MRHKNLFPVLALVLLCCPAAARAQQRQLTIEDIYDPAKRIKFGGTWGSTPPPPDLVWTSDGQSYLQGKTESGVTQLLKVNALTGSAAPFFDAPKMEAALSKLPGVSADDARRLAHSSQYHLNPAQTAVLFNFEGDLIYYVLNGPVAVRLTSGPEEEFEEDFSPDGRMVSFVRGNKRGYWWSPDSTRLAYLSLDETPVHDFPVVDHIPRRQTVEDTPYPLAGDPNPLVRLGVVAAAGGETRWVDTSAYQPADFLLVRVTWSPDSRRVV